MMHTKTGTIEDFRKFAKDKFARVKFVPDKLINIVV